ncbi:MAG: hypothetical protein HOY75_08930 [Streptomyces sp.]|nr:hypothetical protein [Streptomyces sp.]
MSPFQPTRFHQRLVATLDTLASNPDKQLDYVHRLGVSIDELALEFDDAYRLASGKAQEGLVSDTTLNAINPINEHLRIMTEMGPALWTEAALRSAQEWRDLRDLAQSAKSRLIA